jgi:hypothetical protein
VNDITTNFFVIFCLTLAVLIQFQIAKIFSVLQLKILRKAQRNVMLKNSRIVSTPGIINFGQHAHGNPKKFAKNFMKIVKWVGDPGEFLDDWVGVGEFFKNVLGGG